MVARGSGLPLRVVAANGINGGSLIGRGSFAETFKAVPAPAAAFAAFRQREGRPVRIATLPARSVPATILQYWLDQVAHIPAIDRQRPAIQALVNAHVRATALILSDSARAASDISKLLGQGLVAEATLAKALTSQAMHLISDPHAIIEATRPIPPLAWIPFALIWFGATETAAAFVIAIGVFWGNYFATIAAVAAIDPGLYELAAAFGRRGLGPRLAAIVLPGAAPGMLSGLRTGLGQGWMAVVAAELFGIPGIGQRMSEAAGLLATNVLVLYMLTIALLYAASDIELRDLAFGYRDGPAIIEGLSLSIVKGGFVALVGPSGSGKSSVLRVIAGLIPPRSGQVRLRPAGIGSLRPTALVFQEARLLPWRRVRANVEYGLEGFGLDRATRNRLAGDAIATVGLADHATRWPHQLSGHQRQRVGIARALAVEPALLLVDEPFGALDAITRRSLKDELLRTWQQTGATIIFVTHDLDEAVYLADRVLLLAGTPARIVRENTVDLPRPRSRDAAELGTQAGLLRTALAETSTQGSGI